VNIQVLVHIRIVRDLVLPIPIWWLHGPSGTSLWIHSPSSRQETRKAANYLSST